MRSDIEERREMRNDTTELLAALRFAARKHSYQRRKDEDASPFINHPIAVAEVLARIGGVTDIVALQAAVLHDTIEDTETTAEELEAEFGPEVAGLVAEMTDDKQLRSRERKRLQVEHAPGLTDRAKLIKIADKICNVTDVTHAPPAGWSVERRHEYLDWTEAVVAGCRGVNAALERTYDERLAEGRRLIGQTRDGTRPAR
jgi:(p)ppGpp synthase/HD superfamily hydrolase